jgi:hypothetical protein
MPFQPGQSGNPSGRAKRGEAHLKALADAASAKVMKQLIRIATGGVSDATPAISHQRCRTRPRARPWSSSGRR